MRINQESEYRTIRKRISFAAGLILFAMTAVITRNMETLAEYMALRDLGYSPAKSLKPFEKVLSYRPEKAVNVKYDAYRELFPLNKD